MSYPLFFSGYQGYDKCAASPLSPHGDTVNNWYSAISDNTLLGLLVDVFRINFSAHFSAFDQGNRK